VEFLGISKNSGMWSEFPILTSPAQDNQIPLVGN
jgi:hypothetical protein